ncbi:uncharacterized protein EI90DRAFT_3016019 [Cantharellus anzutake]|uniref:uncharacterized protein n=1 Tax=Cantharellus anzutake TaxID=1750568 RepID=UPI001905C05C|nr:uncharacterized protein EI90DRAFT_3016019 [Cantharellus anzutake]KAF8331873.1 hypothetical protein EI90DRAFT_3016019 [Cantharellus anzutake]
MARLYDAYDLARQIYATVLPFIPESFIYSLKHLYAQCSHLFYVLITSPSNLQNEVPAILSTLALAISLYWTITSTIRATQTAFRVTFFFLKYGTIVATLLAVLGTIYPQGQGVEVLVNNSILNNLPRAIVSGWYALTRTGEVQKANAYRQSKSSRSQRTSRADRRKPWERFDSGPSSDKRSKTNKATLRKHEGFERPHSDRSTHENRRRLQKTDEELSITSRLIGSVLRRTQGNEDIFDWTDLGMGLSESSGKLWDEFKTAFLGAARKGLDDDEENISNVR